MDTTTQETPKVDFDVKLSPSVSRAIAEMIAAGRLDEVPLLGGLQAIHTASTTGRTTIMIIIDPSVWY